MTATTRYLSFVAVAALLAGCGGGDDGSTPPSPSIRAELAGINDDPHWLVNPGYSVDQSFAGYASPADLVGYGISRVRFSLQVDGRDLNQAFALYDPVIAAYRARGVHVLVVLGSMTEPFDPNNPDAMPQDLIDGGVWDDFVNRFATVANLVADHWDGQVDAYEIMNEMNVTNGAARYIPPDAYSELLQWAHDAIAGRALVVSGGLYGHDEDSGAPGNSYLGAVDLDYADAIAVHPYGYWPGPVDNRPDGVAQSGTFDDVLSEMVGFGKPIWLTEWNIADDNFGSDPAAVNAGKETMFTSFFDYVANDSRVDQAYFFAWSDANENGFGIMNADGTPKSYVGDLENQLGNQIAATPAENLHGDVVDDATGAPIAPPYGVTIYTNGIAGVPVRDDGTFELPGITAGQPRSLVAINDKGTIAYGAWDTVIPPGVGSVGTIHVRLSAEQDDPSAVGSVSGTVFDSRTSQPLAGADGIFVYCGGRRAAVASDGSYMISGVRAGAHVIVVANTSGAARWATSTWSVAVESGQTARQDFYLQPL